MKKSAIMLGSLMLAATATATEPAAGTTADSASEPTTTVGTDLVRLDADVRVDWQIDRPDGHTDNSQTGFKGKYIMLRLDGRIIDGLTYSWRQRINKIGHDESFFDATDWLYLNYAFRRWNFQAGKQVVAIGGWEYDKAPIDLYGTSVFWNNIPCFDLGISAGYNFTSSDRLTAQVTQSPFFTSDNRNMYAYNLFYGGSHGIYEALWSANLIEYDKGRYINYIALGNRFHLGKHWHVDLDLMNRAATGQTFLFKDCSVMGEISYSPNNRWRIHAKMTYDVNRSGTDKDYTVFNGTELTMAGGGVEFFPLLKNRTSLRLHANAYYSWGRNTNTADLMQRKTLFASVGITWHMNIFRACLIKNVYAGVADVP